MKLFQHRSAVDAPAITVTILVFAFLLQPLANGGEMQRRINTDPANVAIKGYDTVAYFTEERPVKGKPEFTFLWQGAKWQFASSKHLELFAADPERYAPQFGGFCSMALTKGVMSTVDPDAWTIVDGKLYLNFNKAVRDKFRENPSEHVKKASAQWQRQMHDQP